MVRRSVSWARSERVNQNYQTTFYHFFLLPRTSQENMIEGGWFHERSTMWPGQAMSLEIKKMLLDTRSQYQHIQVFERSADAVYVHVWPCKCRWADRECGELCMFWLQYSVCVCGAMQGARVWSRRQLDTSPSSHTAKRPAHLRCLLVHYVTRISL